ncbi:MULTISPECIES: DUF485 domain-containing protein [Streptomyces]|uniref:DUF485 domain-containing protein n=1 Tax=Streptomyces caniscabiei TaxID=2746961 RepID=A0ABU4N026_9ACTN|nr:MULTISPECIES: DUF485 domain-containing protein [Streptomyces]MDX2945123.1 DUF485 domain-containing protein [Streptomyces caniscabiei]MDX2954375.1 DUF485 domain-containing protein [Streptomyces caniscabiei]MDX2987751.1 DUF485 domain-containing protein [Streptomyces caniscabiei]MDX3010723.1 DUF485 domain-containing protein [Streptomyces caniscabiei]MDX3043126.1 DUF485 domain-containing protein [Streptomyces caniscabiei]
MLLYLSHLDHERLYSEDELSRAIHDCHRSYGSAVDLYTWYGQSLSAGQAAHAAAVVRERREWALRIAADLADRHPYDRALPWCSGVTLAEALRSVGVDRTVRDARRRAFLVAAPVIGLYLAISCLGGAAESVMTVSVLGPLNVGLLLGLVQLLAVAAWVQWYGRYCGTSVDPLVESPLTSGERREHHP